MAQHKNTTRYENALDRFRGSSGFGLAILAAAFTLTLSACGRGTAGTMLQLKSPATGEQGVAGKPSYAFTVPTFSRMRKAPLFVVYAANYDLDHSHFALSMDKPLTSDDQIRIVFNLGGEAGANEESPPKAGIYSAAADDFMKVETVIIFSRKGGIESRVVLNRNSSLTGTVKVTSVSNDTIAGDVNLSSGETAIKGAFGAKILHGK